MNGGDNKSLTIIILSWLKFSCSSFKHWKFAMMVTFGAWWLIWSWWIIFWLQFDFLTFVVGVQNKIKKSCEITFLFFCLWWSVFALLVSLGVAFWRERKKKGKYAIKASFKICDGQPFHVTQGVDHHIRYVIFPLDICGKFTKACCACEFLSQGLFFLQSLLQI